MNTIAVRSNLARSQGVTFRLSEYGFLSLYDGISAGIMRQVFYATSRFGLFETFRDYLHNVRGKTDFAARYVMDSFQSGCYCCHVRTTMAATKETKAASWMFKSIAFLTHTPLVCGVPARVTHTHTHTHTHTTMYISMLLPYFCSVGVGAVTGAMAAYLSCPMEVATVRLSNDATLPVAERRNYKGFVDTFARIIREEGFGAFWRGSSPFVMRAMLVGIFQVATLDQFKDTYASLLGQKRNSIPNVFCAAMTSGLIYSVATMPLEASKNRMASQKPDPTTGKLPYTSTLQTLRSVIAKDGFLSFYNGFFPYYLRCGGHTVCMFIFVQMIRDNYRKSFM